MASKMFEFQWNFNDGSVIETAKAYGFQYHDNAYWNPDLGNKVTWLPKSQVTVEAIEDDGSIWWHEGDCLVSVPMWLAAKHDYFKSMFR